MHRTNLGAGQHREKDLRDAGQINGDDIALAHAHDLKNIGHLLDFSVEGKVKKGASDRSSSWAYSSQYAIGSAFALSSSAFQSEAQALSTMPCSGSKASCWSVIRSSSTFRRCCGIRHVGNTGTTQCVLCEENHISSLILLCHTGYMTSYLPPSSAPVRRRQAPPPIRTNSIANSAGVMAVVVAIMWILEVIDTMLGNTLDHFGIHSWTGQGLWEIFTAPWLHYGWAHLAGNSVPLFVLGMLVYLESTRTWIVSGLTIMVCSGLFAWCFSAPGTITLGASGIVFGWLAYLLVRGLFTKRLHDILIAIIVFLIYGSVLWGVLPGAAGVSWQAHLGGAVGGVISASRLARHSR